MPKYRTYGEWQEAATLAYADELLYLETNGWTDAHPTETGGGCTAIYARKGGVTLLATDSDAALVRTRDDEEATDWGVSLYDAETSEFIEEACTEAPTFAEAVQRAEAAIPTQ